MSVFGKLVECVRGLFEARKRPSIVPGESPLVVFVSSVMKPALNPYRDEVVRELRSSHCLMPWAFEYTPASSEPSEDAYLRKVRESDFVVWLAGEETTEPVRNEVREALSSQRRLVVVRLAIEHEGKETRELVDLVQKSVKWTTAATPKEVGRVAAQSIGDEVVRAIRGRPGQGLLARLEEMRRESRARSITRWRSLGLSEAEATTFADDPLVVSRLSSDPKTAGGLQVVAGVLGSGKSLIAERLLQDALRRFRDDAGRAVPIFIAAVRLDCPLREAVLKAAEGIGNPQVQGTMLVLDGADEVGACGAAVLLDEARVLAHTWPKSSIVVTTRPLPTFSGIEERVEVQPLSDDEACSLMSVVSGFPFTTGAFHSWPKSVRFAVHRPLFALLAGMFMRGRRQGSPASTAELVEALIDRATERIADKPNAMTLLERLAALSIDQGAGPVHPSGLEAATLPQLLNTGLVVQDEGGIRFPLSLMTEWFGSRSLVSGAPRTEDLLLDRQRLERWLPAIAIAVGTANHECASRLISPIAADSPAIASTILSDGLSEWQYGGECALPTSLECGRRVRDVMRAWVVGLGPLARAIAPVDKSGNVVQIGARAGGSRLVASWCAKQACAPVVVELPNIEAGESGGDHAWRGYRAELTGRQPAWAWRWALDDLVIALSDLLNARRLSLPYGPLAKEAAWRAALDITARGSLDPGPVPVAEIQEKLELLRKDRKTADLLAGWHAIPNLEADLRGLQAAGRGEYAYPWPGRDREIPIRFTWDGYSHGGLLARARAVYLAAIDAYTSVVDTWFPRLANRLRTYAIQPARFVGQLRPSSGESGITGAPSLYWYWEPLPSGPWRIDLSILEPREARRDSVGVPPGLLAMVQRMRPDSAHWMGAWSHGEIVDRLFGATPVTEIVYSWLWSDLERVSWVEGMLKIR